MRTNKMMALLLGAGLSVGSFATLSAQEGEKTVQAQPIPRQVVTDSGVQAVTQAQASPEIVAPKRVSASSHLRAWARKQGFLLRWDKKKKRVIVVESSKFDCSNPAQDKDFFEKRQMAATEAILKAKAKIIEFCNQQMEAMDKVSTPGNDLNKQFGQRAREIEAALLVEKEKLAKICEQFDKAQADQLRGTTFSDRLDALMVGIIKKIDSEYNPNAKDEKLKARVAEIQQAVDTQRQKIKELEKDAKIAAGKLKKEKESVVATMASMPLYGATSIKYLESFNGKQVEVAIAMVWSITLERAARATVTGEEFKLKPDPNRLTLDAWLGKKKLGDMSGPLQYLDNEGRRYFLGICAADYGNNLSSSTQDENKTIAEQFAKSATAFSVKGDVESYKQAKLMMKTYDVNGKDEDKVAKALQSSLQQTIKSNFNGLEEVHADEYTNHISGKTVWVSVYGIDSEAAKAAIEIEDINITTKIQDERHQTELRGRDAANKAAIESAKNRPEDFQRGAARQSQVIGNKLQQRQSNIQNKNTQPAAGATQKKSAKSSVGVFGDTDDVSDDF